MNVNRSDVTPIELTGDVTPPASATEQQEQLRPINKADQVKVL